MNDAIVMTDDQIIAISTSAWLVGRLDEYRRDLGLPVLDRTRPFLMAMPADMDGALVGHGDDRFLIANRDGRQSFDLPAMDDLPLDRARVGSTAARGTERRIVPLAECHDTRALFEQASLEMVRTGRIHADTHDSSMSSYQMR